MPALTQNVLFMFILFIVLLAIAVTIVVKTYGLDVVTSSDDARAILEGRKYNFYITDADVTCSSEGYNVELRSIAVSQLSGKDEPLNVLAILDTSSKLDDCKYDTGEPCRITTQTSELEKVGLFSARGTLPRLTFWLERDTIKNQLAQNPDLTFAQLAGSNAEFYLGSAEFSLDQLEACIQCEDLRQEEQCISVSHCRWQAGAEGAAAACMEAGASVVT